VCVWFVTTFLWNLLYILFPISFCFLVAVMCIVLFMSAYLYFSLLQHLHFFVHFVTNAVTVRSFILHAPLY